MNADKVREDRLRRMAARQKLTLRKSRRRDPRAYDYGYWVAMNERGGIIREFTDLDEVERWLASR